MSNKGKNKKTVTHTGILVLQKEVPEYKRFNEKMPVKLVDCGDYYFEVTKTKPNLKYNKNTGQPITEGTAFYKLDLNSIEVVKKVADLYVAFPGTGKSFYCEYCSDNSLDIDSKNFGRENFPYNYFENIKKNLFIYKEIFVSTHESVRKLLRNNNIRFTLIYPERHLKFQYLKRYEERGDDKKFIKLIDKNWSNWIDQLERQKCFLKIALKSGQYISDILYIKK